MARMRGDDRQPDAMFSYVSTEQRVPAEHPLRAIRALVDDVLRAMSREFDGVYARVGRPSIPPERLLRAQLLQNLLLDPERAPADGAAGLQPAVPLVRRHGHGAIAEEREAILRAFPQLRDGAAPSSGAPSPAAPRVRGPRPSMSTTERKAVGERMRAYWAKRRAEKGGEWAPGNASASEAATPPVKRNAMSPGRQAQAAKMRAYWAARRAEKPAGGRKTAGRKAGRKK